MRKVLIGSFVTLLLVFGSVSQAKASEGFFELENQIGTTARCYATSGLMEDRVFRILTLCRDILYPGGSEVYSYVAWATPIDGKDPNPVKLGQLGRGKKVFQIGRPFNTMYVTKELNGNTRQPTGQVVMQGGLQTIDFLGQLPNTDEEPPALVENELLDESPSPEPTDEATTSAETENEEGKTRNVFRIIALGGILAFLAIFGVVLIIFVVSRR